MHPMLLPHSLKTTMCVQKNSKTLLAHVCRYEDITSRRLLGKHGRSSDDFDSSPGFGSGATGRHKLLEKRVSKMDRDGFLRPS